jgi:hypothetical protein
VAGAEVPELGDNGIEVAQRLAQKDQGAEQHGLLPLQIGGGEERLHRGCRGEEPRIEDVHQLVAASGDEIEARFEGFQIEGHGNNDRTKMLELRLRSGTMVAFDGRVLEIFDTADASRRFHIAQLHAPEPVETADGGRTLALGE